MTDGNTYTHPTHVTHVIFLLHRPYFCIFEIKTSFRSSLIYLISGVIIFQKYLS